MISGHILGLGLLSFDVKLLESGAIKNLKNHFWDSWLEKFFCRFSQVCNRYRKKALKTPFILNSLGLKSGSRLGTRVLREERSVIPEISADAGFEEGKMSGRGAASNKDDDYTKFYRLLFLLSPCCWAHMCGLDMSAY
jgi:hypothetical protein